MTLPQLKARFDTLLRNIHGGTSANFSTTVESGFEALALVSVMTEYRKVYGAVNNLTHPISASFLNQKPGMFRIERSFKIDFQNGQSFYFATDIEVFGLRAFIEKKPTGILFEADVVVIPVSHAEEVINNFLGYPAPQHIHSAYECKFGKYYKGQLRELVGLKRHLCFLEIGQMEVGPTLFKVPVVNSTPPIAVKMVRPRPQKFFDKETATLYDLEQIIVR